MSTPKRPAALHRHRSSRVLCLATLSALALGAAVGPQTAHASAYGYAFWGVHTFKDVPVPAGELFGAVEGRGTRVDRAGGSFLSAGNICNWSFSIVFIDDEHGHRIAGVVNQSRQRYCSYVGVFKASLGGDRAPEGHACIRLYRDFGHERLAEVITR